MNFFSYFFLFHFPYYVEKMLMLQKIKEDHAYIDSWILMLNDVVI